MNKKILVICPTRGRPRQFSEMIDSFLTTSKISDLVVAVDNDDPNLAEYEQLTKYRAELIVSPRDTITNLINRIAMAKLNDYKYFSATNDDFVYQTKRWDLKLVEEILLHGGQGIAFGNDLLQGVNLPSTSVVSRGIVSALGWLQMPKLTHLYGDTVWKVLGTKAGCLYYRQDVVIEHRHFFSKKVEQDEIYRHTNSNEMYSRDHKAFVEWFQTQAGQQIEQIKTLIAGGENVPRDP